MNVDLKFTEEVSKTEFRNITYSDSDLINDLTLWLEEVIKEDLEWDPQYLRNPNYLKNRISNFIDDINSFKLDFFLKKDEVLEDWYDLEITNINELVKHYSYLLENLPEIKEKTCCDYAPVGSNFCNTCGKKLK